MISPINLLKSAQKNLTPDTYVDKVKIFAKSLFAYVRAKPTYIQVAIGLAVVAAICTIIAKIVEYVCDTFNPSCKS